MPLERPGRRVKKRAQNGEETASHKVFLIILGQQGQGGPLVRALHRVTCFTPGCRNIDRTVDQLTRESHVWSDWRTLGERLRKSDSLRIPQRFSSWGTLSFL